MVILVMADGDVASARGEYFHASRARDRRPPAASVEPRTRQRTSEVAFLAALAVPAFAGLATAWFSRERGPAVTRVKDLMVRDVVTIDPAVTLAEAATRMRDHNVGILPVVVHGKLAGVVTDRDLVVRALAEGADPTLTVVGEFASAEPIYARPDTHLGRPWRSWPRVSWVDFLSLTTTTGWFRRL
jgi:hypothetical protein